MTEADDVLVTKGVQSTVIDGDETTIGHVLLLDCDDAEPFDVWQLAAKMDGVRAVLKSSDGSYHLWNLSVGPLEDHILRALDLKVADDAHVGASYRRGYFVLRLIGKVTEDGKTYKSRPTVCDVWASSSDLPQSRAHYETLRSLVAEDGSQADETVLRDFDTESVEWVGSATNLLTDDYATMTDEAKEVIRGD